MNNAVGIDIDSHELAPIVDPIDIGGDTIRDINRCEDYSELSKVADAVSEAVSLLVASASNLEEAPNRCDKSARMYS